MNPGVDQQRGMTLIELMVAMLIGMLLIGGVIQLFIGSKHSYQLSQTIIDLQDSARYASLMLARDIRMAGYLGCNSRGAKVMELSSDASGSVAAAELLLNTTYDPTSSTMNDLYVLQGGLQGWEAAGTSDTEYTVISGDATSDVATSGSWTSSATNNAGDAHAKVDEDTNSLPRSDVIRLWSVRGEPAVVESISGSSIHLTDNPDVDDGEMLLLTDCASINIVRVCSISGDTVTTNGCTGVTNDNALVSQSGALAFALVGKTYFVGRRIGNDAQSTPTLYLREWRDPTSSRAQPILENIESLQFLYGEDTDTQDPDGIANRYITAADVSNWSQVVSVRMQILMQSERTDLLSDTQTFTFNGKANVTGSDGRLRYAFISTISLRNRAQ